MEEAQGMMKLVEQLKEERELLRSTTSVSNVFVVLSDLFKNVVQQYILNHLVLSLKACKFCAELDKTCHLNVLIQCVDLACYLEHGFQAHK